MGRKFTATAVNRLWLTDITEHPTGEGKLYMCAVKDVYSGRIVGYSIDARMIASLAVSALRNAVVLRDPVATIVHSDRGSQFRSHVFVRTLRSNDLRGSMRRCRRMRRQRREGVVLLAPSEEHPKAFSDGPPAMNYVSRS